MLCKLGRAVSQWLLRGLHHSRVPPEQPEKFCQSPALPRRLIARQPKQRLADRPPAKAAPARFAPPGSRWQQQRRQPAAGALPAGARACAPAWLRSRAGMRLIERRQMPGFILRVKRVSARSQCHHHPTDERNSREGWGRIIESAAMQKRARQPAGGLSATQGFMLKVKPCQCTW